MDTLQKERETSSPGEGAQKRQTQQGRQRPPEGRQAEQTRRMAAQGSAKPQARAQGEGRAQTQGRTQPQGERAAGRPQTGGAAQSGRTAAQSGQRRAQAQGQQAAQARPAQEEPQRRQAAGRKAAAPAKDAPRRKESKAPAKRRGREETDLSGTKRRAYGNSKPKKKPALARFAGSVSAAMEKARARRAARLATQPRKRQRSNAPAVIYTEPKAFSRRRLAVQLVTVAAVVAALVLGLSVFFKVRTITVTGAEVYTAWTVREASGISEGDSLLTFSRARAGAQIKANLPYVKTVRFGIKLPDTVNIIVEEEDVVYAVKDTTGTWWLISSKGRVVEQAASGKSSNYTQLLGFTLANPSPDTQAIAAEAEDLTDDATGSTAATVALTTTSNAQRLSAALEIVSALEDNDIVGEAASVDVSNLDDIILWYGTRYEVTLGDTSSISYKIACMADVILQMSDYQSGILDISFTIWPDQVGYSPFS